MDVLGIQELAVLIGGRVQFGSTSPPDGLPRRVGRIVADVADVAAEDVFWAPQAPEHDVAASMRQAYAHGARGVVVASGGTGTWTRLSETRRPVSEGPDDAGSAEASRTVAWNPPAGCFSIEVDDTWKALQQLVRWHRQRLAGRVIAVGGPLGKTTTVRMIEAVLSGCFSGRAPLCAEKAPWSLPLAVLQLQREDAYGVLECHASRKDEIPSLSHLCQPEIGVINSLAQNVNSSGEEGEGCEPEWLPHLPEHGWAVLNGDEPRLCDWADRVKSRVMLVGRGSHCDLNATHVRGGQGELKFSVEGIDCTVRIWGRHSLPAALAAYAVGRIMGLSPRDAAARLKEFQPLAHRCQVACQNCVTVIDDTYGGGFESWRAALEVLREVETTGRRIVACGGVGENEQGTRWEREIGRAMVAQCGADWLIACGSQGRRMVEAAQAAGMPVGRAVWRPQIKDAAAQLRQLVQPGDAVLVKGGGDAAWELVVRQVFGRPLASAA